MSIEVFNSSSNCIVNLVHNKNKFIDKLQRVLMEQSFYSVISFLDNWNVMRN